MTPSDKRSDRSKLYDIFSVDLEVLKYILRTSQTKHGGGPPKRVLPEMSPNICLAINASFLYVSNGCVCSARLVL